MKILKKLILLLLPWVLVSCQQAITMEETEYEGRPHILVKTRSLDYYYDIQGGGYSRIIDREGKDWVSFKMEPWGTYPASAASSYRGLPNLVFRDTDDGAGHPGHDRCTSRIEEGRIVTESLSGLWLWNWTFYDDHAVLEILKTDPDRSYWFLYEGTPGGTFDPGGSYYGSNKGGQFPGGHDAIKGDVLWGNFRWMYAGHANASGTFYMIQEQEDELTDMISFLGNTKSGLDSPDGMTVFGFGREKGTKPLLRGKQRFFIGLYPEKVEDEEAHIRLNNYLDNLIRKRG